jgi:hypothetical protein
MTTAYPLSWPTSWPRRATRKRAAFRVSGVHAATQQVLHELRRLGAREVLVSSNVELRLDGLPRSGAKAPSDPAVAVYFTVKGRPAVLACDAWDLPEHNLVAIAKHVEAIRGQARWGVGSLEQAFTGYLALPPARNGKPARPWHEVLEFDADTPRDPGVVRDVYRLLAKSRHPDAGGSAEAFKELTDAYEEGMRACGGAP